MAAKKGRRCSLCRSTGHNKRTCRQTKKGASRSPKPSVIVRVGDATKPSSHVLNLKRSHSENAIESVAVFRAKARVVPQRVTVDLAQMIRAAAKETRAARAASQSGAHQKKRRTVQRRRQIRSIVVVPIARVRELFSGWSLPRTVAIPVIRFSIPRFRTVALMIGLVAILPFPAVGYYHKVQNNSQKILQQSSNAFLALQSSTFAALQSNIPQAEYDLNVALASFDEANSIIEEEHRALVYVASLLPVIGAQVSARQHLLSAGHHLALGNTYLVRGIDRVGQEETSLTERLEVLRAHLRSAIPQYTEALEDLSVVSASALPVEYQGSFEEFKLLYATVVNDMQDLSDLIESFETILGADDLRRYLLVFQNNHELRPTGGFLGSFATIDVQKGRITKLEVPGGGTYDLQGQLDVFVEPPLPLQLVNSRWEFQDANWFPDFPASAEKMEWFYEHGRGATMDGVIAMNASVLERLLSVIGPIESETHEVVLSATDVLDTLQSEVELDYDPVTNVPKAVIGDVLSELLVQLPETKGLDMVLLLSELHEALQQSEIQIYLNDGALNKTLSDFGWGGEIQETSPQQDYLMVVQSNIQGQKSDARITQHIEHQAVVQADGSVIDTVFIRRTHTGIPGEQFYGGTNMSYLRLYVPDGAVLLDAGGFRFPPEEAFHVPELWYEEDPDLLVHELEVGVHGSSGTRVTNEFGKTAFGNWMAVGPGETTEVFFQYRLPFDVIDGSSGDKPTGVIAAVKDAFGGFQPDASRYSLVVQKQSGTQSSLHSSVIYPPGWRPVWRYNDAIDLVLNGAEFETMLETDAVVGIVMEQIGEGR